VKKKEADGFKRREPKMHANKLAGALMYDPCIGQFDYVQEEVPTYPFVVKNSNLFNFNQSFMHELEMLHKECGYADFLEEYLVYPARKHQPAIAPNDPPYYTKCDIFDLALDTAFDPNPCFNVYEIPAMCPIPFDPLGYPTIFEMEPVGFEVYFNRPDVKKALHAPSSVQWSECGGNPFIGDKGTGGPEAEGDLSADPIQKVLPQVIEATNRVLVANGDYDMIIITDGTLLSIQNMTWNGRLGFEEKPWAPINIRIPDLLYTSEFDDSGNQGVDGPQGLMGVQHYERGLLWAETYQSGHMQPQYQPRVSYRHLQWLLGHIETL
jgi:carboxypeptidase D